MYQMDRRELSRLIALFLFFSAVIPTAQHPAGASGHHGIARPGSGDSPVAYVRQEPTSQCPAEEEPEAGARICPTPDDASSAYIESLLSDVASNGIAVTLTDAGLEHAGRCDGAETLSAMVAQLYARLPERARAEESIGWAIPQMTGEIHGHARLYAAATSEAVRNAANPVNIVFPEYRGEFPEGASGLNYWAQQVYYGSLCP